MSPRAAVAAGSLVAVLATAGRADAQIRLGPDFQANTYTTYGQSAPAVASDTSGNFVIVWQSRFQDGNDYGVFGRRYNASGVPLSGSEFRVNAQTMYAQVYPRVASSATGQLIVAWNGPGDGDLSGVFARRFNAAGAPAGLDFAVNTYTSWSQQFPAVASDPAGNAVVVWQSFSQDGSDQGVFGQRYDASGVPQGPEFQVNTYTEGRQHRPSVAMDASGRFVVVWASLDQDGSSSGIVGRRYDAAGVPQGGEFVVNSYTPDSQFRPSVASDASGNFVVTWGSYLPGGNNGILGQRFSAAGVRRGGEFNVSPSVPQLGIAYNQVASDPAGNFTVVWVTSPPVRDVYGRHYDADGVAQGGEFLVNAFTTGYQTASAIAASDGRFVVAWTDLARDGYAQGVFAQRLVPDRIFRDGFEQGDLAAWSGSATDAGDLSISTDAALAFTTAGLQGVVDDTAGLYVEDTRPAEENRYRARFYLDPNSFDPGEAQAHLRTRVFIVFEEAPTRRLAAVVLRRQGGAYALMLRCRLDDNSQDNGGFFGISDAPHFVELDWRRSSGPDALDGSCEMWIDGSSMSTRSGLDNSISAVDFVRLGALSVKTGATGTLYWDEFDSRRLSYIGP